METERKSDGANVVCFYQTYFLLGKLIATELSGNNGRDTMHERVLHHQRSSGNRRPLFLCAYCV